ncbi:hypothetical protein [Adlercreutzia equolifaciens]|uniref:hypothetical protein n=1 Tax=Adlercreutzia equolifaciens TaxID=446660 RepID=UPI003AAC69A5
MTGSMKSARRRSATDRGGFAPTAEFVSSTSTVNAAKGMPMSASSRRRFWPQARGVRVVR